MKNDLVAVIMAGGAGTRFWPLSTDDRPKQFIALTEERTMIQMSFDRIADLVGPEKVFVLTSDRYVDLVREQLPDIPPENVVGEPARRDTAAAVALAALLVEDRYPDHTMIVLTADHVIEPVDEFHRALTEAAQGCGNGVLYTLGIEPAYPATQFGYLEVGEKIDGGTLKHYTLNRFKEKPKFETARQFLDSGGFYWNSGMFVWKTRDILAEFESHLPRHLEILAPVIRKLDGPEFVTAFGSLESISVDYAILEKARSIRAVIPRIEWDDVGSWLAASKYLECDEKENCVHGVAECDHGSGNTVFVESAEEEVLLLGVSDLVVVRSEGRTLVAHKDSLDSLKSAVARLGARHE